jgi:hypothetical protein
VLVVRRRQSSQGPATVLDKTASHLDGQLGQFLKNVGILPVSRRCALLGDSSFARHDRRNIPEDRDVATVDNVVAGDRQSLTANRIAP